MKENFDDFLKKKLKEESMEEEIDYSNIDKIIDDMFDIRRKKRKILLLVLPFILMSSTVFAVAYSIFNLSSVGIDDTCLNIATKNGYIQELNMVSKEYQGLSISIDKFIIDDINMDISFEYRVNNESFKDIKNIYIQDLYIYDESNNILFKEKENSAENVAAKTSGYTKIKKYGDVFKNTLFVQSDNFPRSKKIFIEFNNVILNCDKNNIEVNGEWNFEINVTENMINRKTINYKDISNNNYNENIKIKNMKLTNTGLIINVEALNSEILNDSKIELIINNKKIKANNNIFEKNPKEDKNFKEYIFTYNLTKYDAPDQIKVQIKDKKEEREIIFIKDEET
ncbi:MAG TPA: DUF4179 domain-containing protein [Clostridiaceae bacterium]|nr:DUF4179 domain-containing protein [Clostridiaceae bacterium]